jgi:hypothetical protein
MQFLKSGTIHMIDLMNIPGFNQFVDPGTGILLSPHQRDIVSFLVSFALGCSTAILLWPLRNWRFSPLLNSLLSFFISWKFCLLYLPQAHHLYGGDSWTHRLYDVTSICASLLLLALFRRSTNKF